MKLKSTKISLAIVSTFVFLLSSCARKITCKCNCGGGGGSSGGGDTPAETYDDRANVNYSTDIVNRISSYTYGTFMEFISQCIHTGLWAEQIMDRKFYTPIGEDVSQWTNVGTEDVASVSDRTLSNGYSPRFAENTAIRQSNIQMKSGESYKGYFYAYGFGNLKFEYKIGESTIYSETFKINSLTNFKKTEYTFSSNQDGNASLTISWVSGGMQIDSLSLMSTNTYEGMRLDTLAYLKTLNAPFYRWPGGNFVSGYEWKYAVGDRDTRQCMRNLEYAHPLDYFGNDTQRLASDISQISKKGFYSIIDSNDFGPDEFMTLCKYLNAEPNIVVNAGLGSSDDAADEVEFFNGSSSSTWGSKRAQEAPYNVTYWSIGNEMNGDWQLGYCGSEFYLSRHAEFYNKMIAKDGSIKIIAVGDNYSNWSSNMLSNNPGKVDYISEHFYAPRNDDNVRRHILSMKNMCDDRILRHKALNTNVTIAFDEYAYDKAEYSSSLKDGMGVAAALNSMIYSGVVSMACYSSTINAVQGSITTNGFYDAYMQGNGFVLSLYSTYFQRNAVNISTDYQTDDKHYFELSASVSNDKSILTIAAINATGKTILLDGISSNGSVKRNYVQGKYLDSFNSEDGIELNLFEDQVSKPIVPPLSVAILTIDLQEVCQYEKTHYIFIVDSWIIFNML